MNAVTEWAVVQHPDYRHSLLGSDQENALGRRIRSGDTMARNTLIRSNLRLVLWIAEQFPNRYVRLSERISEGNMALIRAAERFNPERRIRFGAYAAKAIRRRITHAIGVAVRIAKRERPLHEGRDLLIAPSVTDELETQETLEPVITGVSRLSKRERLILDRRYGLNGNDPHTFEALGRHLHVTRQRARQLHNRALRKLRADLDAD
jgi:RNA polymerase sigma factor (sigma-70 family)